ncbi:hypothetical protein IMY05_C4349000800 [Salix suchowensis]|nr:hypothetical protein IMY05_C4349000800 [Salix suchowensis]
METSFDDDDDSFDVQVKALERSQEAPKDTTKGPDSKMGFIVFNLIFLFTLSKLLTLPGRHPDVIRTRLDETQALSLVETPISEPILSFLQLAHSRSITGTPQLSPKNASPSTAKPLDDGTRQPCGADVYTHLLHGPAYDNTELMKKAFHSRKPPINSSATPRPNTLSMAPPPVHALKIVKRSRLQQPTQARPRSSNLPEEINAIRPSSSRPISYSLMPRRIRAAAVDPRVYPPRLPVSSHLAHQCLNLYKAPPPARLCPLFLVLQGGLQFPTGVQGQLSRCAYHRAVTSPALPSTTMTGPLARRVPLGIPESKTPSVTTNSPAGVLKPSRIPGKVSGLPRIASAPSRLPGPSAISRGRSAGDVGNATTRLVRPVPGRRIN